MRVYTTRSRKADLTGILGQIVHLCGLDSYGARLLERRAAVSLKAVAVLLAVNFVFDLGAWWLLFNAVFGGGRGVFELGLHSAFAMLFSLLISMAILIYEQQFMTTDISGQRRRLTLPLALRIAVIIVAAFITTQPVELMFFKGPIERRIHDESIRLEAISRLKDWQDSQKRQGLDGIPEYFRANHAKAEGTRLQEEKNLKDVKSKLREAEVSLSRAKARLDGARARLSNTRSQRYPVETYDSRVASAQAYVVSSQAAVNDASGEVETVKQKISDQQINVDNSIKNEEKASGEIKSQVESAVKDAERVRNWFAVVRQSNRGGVVEESRAGGWTFQDQTYDFFDQLRVLSDLRTGRAARWPEASQEDRDTLASTFNFKTPADELEEAHRDAKFYSYSYWAVFGIAFVIPALLLAFKLLQPQELREYYSKERQESMDRDFDA